MKCLWKVSGSHFIRVNKVLNRPVVVHSDWRFGNLCSSHLQSQRQQLIKKISVFHKLITRVSGSYGSAWPRGFGIGGKALEWFSSYLSGRSQRVLFEGATSDSFDLRFGVPQGSCLGPLLFVVYASKLFEIVQDHLPNAHCFADDTQLYLSFDPNSPTDQAMALEAMERSISDLRKWI